MGPTEQLQEATVDLERRREHLKLLAIFNFVLAGVRLAGLLSVVLVYFFILAPTHEKMDRVLDLRESTDLALDVARDHEARGSSDRLTIVVLVSSLASFMTLAGIVHLAAGFCLLQHRRRTFCYVAAIFGLLDGSFAMALGIFMVVILGQPDTKELFRRAAKESEDHRGLFGPSE